MALVSVPGVPGAWAVTGPASTYVVAATTDPGTGEARVVQRYWGPALPEAALPEAAAGPPPRPASGFFDPADADELLPVDGGTRWGVPSLQAEYPGGIRSVEFAHRTATASGDLLTITLRDDAFGLEADLCVRDGGDGVVERHVTVRLDDDAPGPVRIARLDSGSWRVPDRDRYRYTGVHGAFLAETHPRRGDLPVGELTFTSRSGSTGHRSNPWIMIDDGRATEEHGDVWSVALAWSGSWRLTAQHRAEGDVTVTAGFGHDGPRWRLAPAESLTTPAVVGLFRADGFGGASRAWHAYARRRVLPAGGDGAVRPVLYNSWEATGFAVTEGGQTELARRAAGLGAELFVVDDGWFGGRTGDHAGLGDWTPRIDLERVFAEVRALGMVPGLWVEPEMVNPDSDLYRARPDWVLHLPGRRRDTLRNQLVLNFARADVRAWALDWLGGLVERYGLAFLKWDMNRSFTQAGWPEAGERADMLWIEHVRGVYAVLDELRRRHRRLRVESCSGGGGRVDLGILARTDQVWTSDNTDARDRQVIQYGFTHLYPPGVMTAWVTDGPNAITGRDVPLRYRFHVAMAGVLGIGGDLAAWGAGDLALARDLVARYKRVRRVVQHGDLYRLAGTPGVERSAVQYVLDDTVVVLAYNPYAVDRAGPRRLRLAGLDPDARYAAADGLTGTWHGRYLTAAGLRPPCWSPTGPDYRSDLIVLRRTA